MASREIWLLCFLALLLSLIGGCATGARQADAGSQSDTNGPPPDAGRDSAPALDVQIDIPQLIDLSGPTDIDKPDQQPADLWLDFDPELDSEDQMPLTDLADDIEADQPSDLLPEDSAQDQHSEVLGSDLAVDSSSCSNASECQPGKTDEQILECGNCGTETQTRTCNPLTCEWNAWVGGSCDGEGICTPGEKKPGCDTDLNGHPTSCGEQTCTDQCSWGTCELALGASCMSDSGTSFQCCTPPAGGSGWQFCSSVTCQWFPCAAHACQ